MLHARVVQVTENGRAPFRLSAHQLITDGEMTLVGAVRGPDFAGELGIELYDLDELAQIVVVDETAWVLDPDRGWQRAGEDMDPFQPTNPFVGGVSSFQYVRSLPRGAERLHMLRTTEWTGPSFYGPFRNLRIASSVFDVYVTDDGVPIEGHIDYVATGRALGIDGIFLSVRINYTFSDFGEPVVIEQPVEGTSGIPS